MGIPVLYKNNHYRMQLYKFRRPKTPEWAGGGKLGGKLGGIKISPIKSDEVFNGKQS